MPEHKPGRLADVAIGLFCIAMALAVLFYAWEGTPIGACLGALVLALLGVDALVGVARGRRSLISRIGPLP